MTDADQTLAELTTPSTAADAQAYLVAQLATRRLPVTNWSPVGLYRSLVASCAAFLGDLGARVPLLAKSGFLRWATGGWLDLLAASAYGIEREAATFAVVHCRLTNASGSVYTITPGQLWMTLATPDGRRWNCTNSTNATLSASSTLDLDFRAEFAGSGYNLSFPGPPSLTLQTPLSGVTIAALECVDDALAGLGTVMVTTGADAESDPQLAARCAARWGSLAWAGPALAYQTWALEASDAVRRVYIDDGNPSGPGTVSIYLAGDSGAVGAGDVTAVDDVLQVRKPPCSIVTTLSATNTTVAFVAQAQCPSESRADARLYVYDQLQALLRALPIGDGSGAGKLRYHQVERIILDAPGVVDLDSLTLNAGTSSVTPTKGHVLVASPALDTTLSWLTFVDPS